MTRKVATAATLAAVFATVMISAAGARTPFLTTKRAARAVNAHAAAVCRAERPADKYDSGCIRYLPTKDCYFGGKRVSRQQILCTSGVFEYSSDRSGCSFTYLVTLHK